MYLPLSDASGMPQTVYSAQGGSAIGRAELGGLLDADAVVVGGGFVGCAAALYLAEAGRATVLLENNEVGWGAAGRNAGHVAAHATKLEPDAVLSVYGPIYGPRLNEVGAGAPRMVIDLADRHSMDISIVRGGILTGAHTEAAFAKLQRRARYWRDRGAPVELLDGRATAETIGGGFYFGSVIDRRGIAVNPLALVRGLARAAIAAGARIFERSKVARLRRDGDRWRVETASGTVRCSHVLLCTNAYTDELWPGLRETVIPVDRKSTRLNSSH